MVKMKDILCTSIAMNVNIMLNLILDTRLRYIQL